VQLCAQLGELGDYGRHERDAPFVGLGFFQDCDVDVHHGFRSFMLRSGNPLAAISRRGMKIPFERNPHLRLTEGIAGNEAQTGASAAT
jgi:hypothetical protein